MAIYYIDPHHGCDCADGLSPEKAKKDYRTLDIRPGDTVAFKRGSFIRGKLETVAGAEGAPVTYTSYGEGELPIFCASTDVSSPDDWEEVSANTWRCKKDVPGEVGNFVFDEDVCTAALRWTKEELTDQGHFWDSRFGQCERKSGDMSAAQEILLYSMKNPGLFYNHIECVSFAGRNLCTARDHMVVENLSFRNSGVHALTGGCRDVTIRGCDFRNIGGCVWDRGLEIRFGNAVEFWTIGEDILLENCSFLNVYDSCVTHQGPGEKTIPARNFICRNNVFDTYGMAAFEYRDKLPIDSAFVGNLCRNAGCGFAMLGEILPRKSEIWPQPMGHHIFLWRMESATPGGNLVIAGNKFGPAPVGAAIYSIISPEAEAQITLDGNQYTANDILLNRFGGEDFADFALYQAKTGQDANSSVE